MVSSIWYSIQKFVYWDNYNNFILAVVTWWYCPIKAVIFVVFTPDPVPLLLLKASLELPFYDALHTASNSASVSTVSVILHHFNWILIFVGLRKDIPVLFGLTLQELAHRKTVAFLEVIQQIGHKFCSSCISMYHMIGLRCCKCR